MKLWLDADAAPRDVKEVCFRACERLMLETVLVANQRLQILPGYPHLSTVRVGDGSDIADHYIAEHAETGDVAVTADIPLVALLVPKGVVVIDPRGEEYTLEIIGERLSVRNFMDGLRGAGGDGHPVPRRTRSQELVNRGLYVVMGVTGSGKSVIGAALARALGIDFVEGDEYHPAANVERMSSGIPLTDDDRAGWLRALAMRLREAKDAGTGLVMSCSALKRSYRDILRADVRDLQLVFLRGHRALIAERLANRGGHFMPPSLLDSQFATLEEPSPDEKAWVCDIRKSPKDLVTALVARASA